ncbi:MAG: LytTR family DNA-binding domain-containing protein [Bacteroidetes bacterium]|nr:LytTR family DNA-binding domain-containing protein [Bacteroidota bacterium]
MIRILLIDDERKATDTLRMMLEKFISEDKKVECCNDARQAVVMIHNFKPDLVFLDIRMPHLSGFDILDAVVNKQFKVIFTTAYDEYAIRAIRFSAFDYLLKPVDMEELIQVFKRFIQAKNEQYPSPELFTNISHNLDLQQESQFRLALPSREGVYFLYPSEIIRCEALSAYTRFYTATNTQLLSSRNLGEYEELLAPFHFIRTHKSHLVNKHFISFFDHEGFVVLKDSTKIEVSRRRKEEVMELLRSS